MVGTEETMLSIQQHVGDASFTNVVVIPMGGNIVFLRYRNNEDIMQLFNDAINFFGMIFFDVHKWSSKDVWYERGAWLHVYGTPAYAWNRNFFKLCASECYRFVWADDYTLDREQIDFSRIIISTTSLDVLNRQQYYWLTAANLL
jgi:hypothetical protein